MKLIGICPTYNRSHLVPNVLAMWQEQRTECERELVIFDDAGQFDAQSGDKWRLIPWSRRCSTLGQKFDVLLTMAFGVMTEKNWIPEDVGIVVWEDDDVYFQDHLAACASALEVYKWAAPSRILANDAVGRGKWHWSDATGRHHGAWAYRLDAALAAGGYPHVTHDSQGTGFDLLFGGRLRAAYGSPADTYWFSGNKATYLYRWFSVPGSRNGSAFGERMMIEQGHPIVRCPGDVIPKMDDETAEYYREFSPVVAS